MMRAKTLHPRNSTSSCSKREQRRRHPCKRRHTRAIAVRRVDSSRADAQGLTRVRRGGPTGAYPVPRPRAASGRPRTPGPSAPREERGAGPGESATGGPPGRRGRARASVRRRAPGDRPRQPDASWGSTRLGSDRGMEDRLCARPRAGGRDLDDGAGERLGRPLEAHALFALQMRADPGAPPGLRPAGQPGGEGGARCQSGPATRARCRPARRPTRGRGARGEGRGGQGRAAPGEGARSGRSELACGPYIQETRIMHISVNKP